MAWVLVFSLICSQVFAQTVLVDGSGSELDYRAELKAHADLISPVEAYEAEHPARAEREALIMAFAEAQRKFLENDPPEAMDGFKRVLDFLPRDDWSASDREIFLQTYYRLAQLDEKESDRWLEESLLLGMDVRFDPTLFPPPLIERRQQLFARAAKVLPSETLLGHEYGTVLLAGRPCTRRSCTPVAQVGGKIRVTWLSNRFAPESQILDLEEAKTPHFKPRALAEGGCEETRWSAESAAFAQKRLFHKECAQEAVPKLAPVFVAASRPRPQAALPEAATSEEHTPIYKNKWVWIGAGVLAAGAVAVALSQHPHETKEPTVSYGYH